MRRLPAARRVVLLGRRAPALRAARRLGLEVVRVAGAAAPPSAARPEGVVAELPWPEAPHDPESWRELATALPEPERVAAVAAATEASVLPAAHLRAALGLPGLDVESARRCTDKLWMKQAVRAAGLPCARFLACGPDTPPSALVDALGLPLVLKPRASSGARGLRLVRSTAELPEQLTHELLAESWQDGVEMSCESLLADGEIVFSNATEYLVIREANLVPARLALERRAEAAALERAAIAALGVTRGMTHLELFLGPGGPVFGELAARPPGGHIMRLLALAYGIDPWQAWLRAELGEAPELPRSPRGAAGAWVLHPGAGRLRAVHGLDAARALPGVARLRLRVAPGERVAERAGAGNEIGHLIVRGRDAAEAARRLQAARAAIAFEMEAE